MSDDQAAAAPEHNYEYGREHDGYSHMGIPPACPACAAESKASEPMPDTDPSSTLAGIRAIEQAATPGEWKHRTAQTRGDWTAGSKVMPIERVEADARPGGIGIVDASADAEFIAMARTAVPSLVAALEAVLALAGKLEPQAPSSSALEEDRMWVRQECADMIREAITSALTGTETARGS